MFRTAGFASLLLFAGEASAWAEAPCGIHAISESVAPVYPPIGRAAHVSGVVVLVASFHLDGRVTEARAVSGPVMLRVPAERFVKGWKEDPYTGPRSCPVVVDFRFADPHECGAKPSGSGPQTVAGRIDAQHYRVVAQCVVIYSQPAVAR